MLSLVRERASQGTEVAERPRLGSALIHYYCVAHRLRSVDRSPVTIFQDRWAFCLNGYGEGHDWIAIEPVGEVELLRFGPTFLRTLRRQLTPA